MKTPNQMNGDYLSVKDALQMLHDNGVDWTEVYLRILLGGKKPKIKSLKHSKSRLVPSSEIKRIIGERRAKDRALAAK